MRLLVVEDNEQLAELLTKGLQTAGYETDMLATLEEASQYGSSNDFLCCPHSGSGVAGRRWAGALARATTPKQSNSRHGSYCTRWPLRSRPRPAKRSRRLFGKTVRAGGTGRAAGGSIAAARPSARKLSPHRQSRVRHQKPASIHRRPTPGPVGPRNRGA